MQAIALPKSPLPGFYTLELTASHAPMLQRFFEANPAYFLSTSGAPAGPDEAVEEIASEVPAGWHFTKKWVIGYVDARGELIALANVITDLFAVSVWHIGTFIVATDRHGGGDAQALYAGLERWALDHGAAWMRLGVVQGSARAERFWSSRGYRAVRAHGGILMGTRTVVVQNRVKPLGGAGLDSYFILVPRDRPEATEP